MIKVVNEFYKKVINVFKLAFPYLDIIKVVYQAYKLEINVFWLAFPYLDIFKVVKQITSRQTTICLASP